MPIERSGKPQALRRQPQSSKVGTRSLGIFRPGRHAHQASQVQVLAALNEFLDRGKLLFRQAALRDLVGKLELEKDIEPALGLLVEPAGDLDAIHRLDDVKQARRRFCLVALQLPDEVENRPGKLSELHLLRLKLLDVIFPKVPLAGTVGFENIGRRFNFRNRHDRDFLRRSSRPQGGLGYVFPHLLKPLADHATILTSLPHGSRSASNLLAFGPGV